MSKVTGLGKGLDALLPTGFDTSLLIDAKERVQNLFISDIVPNPEQPRKHFDNLAIEELSQSIKRHGVLQPIIVTPSQNEKYTIVAGERRWRAAQKAGLQRIPAIVRAEKELELLEISLIENVQRVDLSPLEQAISIERLHQQFNMSYSDIAERLGKAATTLNNIVRLLQLPTEAREALEKGRITEGHARAILALKDDTDQQKALLENILQSGWSVRQAEQFVQANKSENTSPKAVRQQMATETPQTKQISARLHVPVTLKRTAKGGRLELHFRSDTELDNIVARLQSLDEQ
jgi:ParB family chromosome partitioning protein